MLHRQVARHLPFLLLVGCTASPERQTIAPVTPSPAETASVKPGINQDFLDPALDVAAVHAAVDAIERAVRLARPQVCRLVSHAEPAVIPAAYDDHPTSNRAAPR